ncbi:hypothetical protein SAMN05216526_1570 [Ectothiorhodosinus mongolicus]|uniref:Uncharacterized protein n=1 Tax=Ectothiorhodosinus mongolicus TaxID=233100 RepID=A0A1R3W332_9GAMM|nr:hypothetical protein [Ectothiorhodosinus mongolicus]ULX57419.1 hypothetical protein CKX93_06865 [Ectothiorhodosinus mongolicus]SIT72087.1 hypothetical protein SAMN05216526_1570 [Ectothiorhodosinus mongolicus]
MTTDRTSPFDPAPEGATVIEGKTTSGKPCRIVDSTASVDQKELKALLDELIAQRRFGLFSVSMAGSDTISLGEPQFAHIQLQDEVYRLILTPNEARIEAF